MLHLTTTRVGLLGRVLLMMMGLASLSLSADSQTSVAPENDRAQVPEAPRVEKPGFVFRASELYLAGGTAFDMTTTVRGLQHPTTALRSDGSFLTHYYVVEKGWAGFLGNRNCVTAVAANVALNVAVDRFSRKLYARGGRWRGVAIAALLAKGTFNVIGASNNIRSDSDERIDNQVRLATDYRDQIRWSQ
jgi:hypothetical protein